jgi:hypothetical protein
MAQKSPTQTEIIGTLQAQLQTLTQLSERVSKVEQQTERQENRNHSNVHAVLLAVVLIVATIAVEVILSNRFEAGDTAAVHQAISDLRDRTTKLETENVLLKIKNPYIK